MIGSLQSILNAINDKNTAGTARAAAFAAQYAEEVACGAKPLALPERLLDAATAKYFDQLFRLLTLHSLAAQLPGRAAEVTAVICTAATATADSAPAEGEGSPQPEHARDVSPLSEDGARASQPPGDRRSRSPSPSKSHDSVLHPCSIRTSRSRSRSPARSETSHSRYGWDACLVVQGSCIRLWVVSIRHQHTVGAYTFTPSITQQPMQIQLRQFRVKCRMAASQLLNEYFRLPVAASRSRSRSKDRSRDPKRSRSEHKKKHKRRRSTSGSRSRSRSRSHSGERKHKAKSKRRSGEQKSKHKHRRQEAEAKKAYDEGQADQYGQMYCDPYAADAYGSDPYGGGFGDWPEARGGHRGHVPRGGHPGHGHVPHPRHHQGEWHAPAAAALKQLPSLEGLTSRPPRHITSGAVPAFMPCGVVACRDFA